MGYLHRFVGLNMHAGRQEPVTTVNTEGEPGIISVMVYPDMECRDQSQERKSILEERKSFYFCSELLISEPYVEMKTTLALFC